MREIEAGCLALVVPSGCPEPDDDCDGPGFGDSILVGQEFTPSDEWCQRKRWWEVSDELVVCECSLLRIDGEPETQPTEQEVTA